TMMGCQADDFATLVADLFVDRQKSSMLTSKLFLVASSFLPTHLVAIWIAVITGYNTDVEHNGVVYHVQTEDKGMQTPVILSLVYSGGAILASKRSSYGDLVGAGFDEDVLAKRLQRQHKLICAAVHAGRIEDLKRMSEPPSMDAAPAVDTPKKTSVVDSPKPQKSHEDKLAPEPPVADDALAVSLIDEGELRGGQRVTLQLLVTRMGQAVRESVPVTVKTLSTNFQPLTASSTTDRRGVATVTLTLPNFKSGRAAILVQAEHGGELAELRRIILPPKP